MRIRRKVIIGAALLVVGLPVALVLIGALAFLVLDRTNGALVSSGVKREYLLHVPDGHDPAHATPLVVSLHGAAHWPAGQSQVSRWNEVADEHRFLVVYPAATGVPKAWHSTPEGVAANVRFIADLIDTLRTTHNVDPGRVYVNGLSNGGGMAFALSCRLPERIAAVGTVAAAHDLPWEWCDDGRPVPLISFHGTADPIVPFDGGSSWVAPQEFPDVPGWTASWAGRNRCGPRPVQSTVAPDVTRLEYTGCANGAAVVLYSILGGGHTWPGGEPMPAWLVGRTSSGVDATREMWAFFREYRLDPPAVGGPGGPAHVPGR
jgi:polyhydroxybutyrate depolymerase